MIDSFYQLGSIDYSKNDNLSYLAKKAQKHKNKNRNNKRKRKAKRR